MVNSTNTHNNSNFISLSEIRFKLHEPDTKPNEYYTVNTLINIDYISYVTPKTTGNVNYYEIILNVGKSYHYVYISNETYEKLKIVLNCKNIEI